jgi:DNA-binding transcriptional LysR family regulator
MSRLPDLEAWAVFAKVAETASFARAAIDLGISKATVSKAIARLEARIGASLLNRTSRRLSLTATGQRAAGAAARILAEAEALEAEATSGAVTPGGLVRISAPMSFGVAHVAPLLPDLLRAYPAISIDLHLSDALVDLIGGGFDLALRIAALADSSLRARRICRVRRLLVGAPSYFARHGRPRHPRDLAAHACLGYGHRPAPERWQFVHPSGETASVAPAGPLRANNGDAMQPMLRAGLALAIQPEFLVAADLAAGKLEIAMTDWTLTPTALNIVMPPGDHRPARITATIDFLARRLSAAAWAGQPATS